MNEYNALRDGLMNVLEAAKGDTTQIVADIKKKGLELPTEQQLPTIISSQYNSIVELEDSVVKSLKLAKEAKNSAKRASDITVHWYGGRREAIELLQNASEYSSKALVSLAEAQNKSFEYQRKLTEITKYLIGLGVSSIAMNRCVVRELELKLKGASGVEISDLAKQELKNVIMQLKSQEDVMKKQEFLAGQVKEQSAQLQTIGGKLDNIGEVDQEQSKRISENAQDIDELERQDAEQDKLIAEGVEKDKVQDAQISENAQDIDELERQDAEQDKLIAEGVEKDKVQDAQISENAQDIDELERQDAEQDKLIAEGVEKDKEQDGLIEKLAQKNEMQALEIAELKEKFSKLENIEKLNKKMIFISYAVGIVATVLTIINFLI